MPHDYGHWIPIEYINPGAMTLTGDITAITRRGDEYDVLVNCGGIYSKEYCFEGDRFLIQRPVWRYDLPPGKPSN